MENKKKSTRQQQEDAVLRKILCWVAGSAALVALLRLAPIPYAGLLINLIIGVCVLAMIYYLYQRDFVAISFVSGLGLLGLWFIFREGRTPRLYAAVAVILLLLVSVAVLARYLQTHDGALTWGGKRLGLAPRTTSYPLVYITCGLAAAVLAAALVLSGAPNMMIYYAVLVAWLLIMAVYYTVKLM